MAKKQATTGMLKDLGLSDEEIDAYLNLLGRGPLTTGEIVLSLNIPFETVNSHIQKFSAKGIVKVIEGVPDRFEAIPPYEIFLRTFEKFAQEFEDIKKDVSVTVKDGIDRLSASVSQIGERIPEAMKVEVTGLDKIATDLSTMLEDMLDQQVTAFKDRLMKTLSSRLTNIKSSFDEVGQTELKKTEKEFTQLFSKITDKLGDLGSEVEKAKEGLTALWHETKKGEYYRPKTLWFVPGRRGILAFFKDMVTRAKRQVMLAAPTIQDIDIEMIKNLPGRVNVRIATYVDLGVPSDRQAFGVLSDIGNVTVRQYEPKDFWGVMVDARETLLAAIPAETTEEFNGIACIADEYNIVFRRLLADVWLSAERIKS